MLIEAGLVGEGISKSRFSVIPFPLEKEDSLFEFFPKNGVCFTTIHSEWNNVKVDILRRLGYTVKILEEPDRWKERRESATEIRRLIKANDDAWSSLVPRRVYELITERYLQNFC